jgi:hypothetical protein
MMLTGNLLADLLASVLEEWSRFYGSTDQQRHNVQAIVDAAFRVQECHACGYPWPRDEEAQA